MAAPLSKDLRERLLRAVEGGLSRRATAAKFEVSPSCVVKLMQRHKQEGTIAPGKMGGALKPALLPHYDLIRSLMATTPDLTIDELQVELAALGIFTSRSPLGRCLLALNLTRKKRRGMPQSKPAPMLPRPAKHGETNNLISRRRVWSSLMKPGPRPI